MPYNLIGNGRIGEHSPINETLLRDFRDNSEAVGRVQVQSAPTSMFNVNDTHSEASGHNGVWRTTGTLRVLVPAYCVDSGGTTFNLQLRYRLGFDLNCDTGTAYDVDLSDGTTTLDQFNGSLGFSGPVTLGWTDFNFGGDFPSVSAGMVSLDFKTKIDFVGSGGNVSVDFEWVTDYRALWYATGVAEV